MEALPESDLEIQVTRSRDLYGWKIKTGSYVHEE